MRPFFRILSLGSLLPAAVLFSEPVSAHAQVWASGELDRYLGYRSWNRLTSEVLPADESALFDCIDPTEILGPHFDSFIHLYANTSAITARWKSAAPGDYPVGAILIKEKFETRDLGKPSIITVMEKRASTGKVTDWRFLMIRLSDRRVIQRNSPESCIKCHSRYGKTGFVSPETDSLLTAFAGGHPPVDLLESKRRKAVDEPKRDSAEE